MSISTYSPVLTLFFAVSLLWILMDLHYQELTSFERKWFPASILLLAIFVDVLYSRMGGPAFSKSILFTLHLPVLLIYRKLTKHSTIKMIFMILSGVVFTAPTVIITNHINRFFPDSNLMLAISNLISFALVLIMAHYLFRKSFGYMLTYGNDQVFLRFSLLPFMYYVYMFAAMRIDSVTWSSLWSPYGAVVRFLPTVQVLVFYFLLLHNFKDLSEKRESDTIRATLSQQLSAAEEQLIHLNEVQIKTSIYQHDMRHHLNAIGTLLTAKKFDEATSYIKKVQSHVDSLSTKRFCENEIFNLLCSSLAREAERLGVRMTIKATLPKHLPIPDPELCAVLSNGIENSLNAVFELPEPLRWVDLYCEVKLNKLLLEIRNPYIGEVILRNNLPVSTNPSEEHGYGTLSIRSIVERHNGLCSFEPNDGIFTLRIVIPLHKASVH